ncbi:hypothetical protein QDT04_16210 [Acinetobacter baumannii]|uniref:hypothetical protein n=1 Tax=Acinetobacter baumannii TaxID=470 RepID=UPI0024475EC9|nr:hypothetical protein [Acinetobacter baumannii]MDH2600826.1 hypothetical protein [Acinetobacter baumannii]
MLEKFEARECFQTIPTNFPQNLVINIGPHIATSYDLLLIRLLLGKLDIYCNKSQKLVKQRINYYTLPSQKEKLSTNLGAYFNTTNINLSNSISAGINRNFYKELFFEFSNYFTCMKNKNFVNSFVHLYRILERVSYALPLIWASKSNDFYGSFSKLKEFFQNKDTKELGGLKLFIKGFVDPYLSITTDFDIISIDPDWQKEYFMSIKNAANKVKTPNNQIIETPYSTISIKNEDIIGFIIEIRNRYFHALTGANASFTSKNIMCTDEFFKIINEPCINWLAFIILEVIKIDLKL